MFASLIQGLIGVFAFIQALTICLLHVHAKNNSGLIGMDVINKLSPWVISP